ncbi:MAG: sulfate transporter CysZ [Klebsiella grimontii]|nr:sulfate transporter CysZ [Klebsiella grimontii]
MVSSSVTTPRSGVYYFSQGWKLIGLPGIRRYVFLPLLVNIILMGGAFWWLFTRLGSWIPSLMSHVPEWLQWLNYLLWPMVVISILLVFGYFFSTIANWIAAPFSGLLAEQLEARLTGATPPDGQTIAPVLWFLFSAWMLAIQYCDYPFDNHKVPFKTMRQALRTRKVTNMQFGALTSLFTMIPILNLVILPVAICGATAMWVDCYRDKHAMWK